MGKVTVPIRSRFRNWESYPYQECTSESFWNKIDHFSVQWWILNRKAAIFASKMNNIHIEIERSSHRNSDISPGILIWDWNLVQDIIFVCFWSFLICFFKILFEKYTLLSRIDSQPLIVNHAYHHMKCRKILKTINVLRNELFQIFVRFSSFTIYGSR